MNQTKLEALLGRPLTTTETTNLKLYLKIAKQQLEDLLCTKIESVTEDRSFTMPEGKLLFIDPFTQINSITVNESELESTEYEISKNDDLNSSDWFNLIDFDNYRSYTPIRKTVITVNADWGFGSCQSDLELLQARLFAMNSTDQSTDGRVKSKDIEDFKVTYSGDTTFEQFRKDNAQLIEKYSQCRTGGLRNGSVCPVYFY